MFFLLALAAVSLSPIDQHTEMIQILAAGIESKPSSCRFHMNRDVELSMKDFNWFYTACMNIMDSIIYFKYDHCKSTTKPRLNEHTGHLDAL